MHRSRSHIAEELTACIRCNECLRACPALPAPITIKTLNRETLTEPISADVARFADACYQCGACVPVCPVGLHRDAMMLWLKMRLLRGDVGRSPAGPGESGTFGFVAADDYPGLSGSFRAPGAAPVAMPVAMEEYPDLSGSFRMPDATTIVRPKRPDTAHGPDGHDRTAAPWK